MTSRGVCTKLLLLLAAELLACAVPCGSDAAPTWLAPVQLGPGVSARLAMNSRGDAVIGWHVGGASWARTASRTAGSQTWSAPVTLADAASTPDVALNDAGDAVALFSKDSAHAQASFRRGLSGGWEEPITIAPLGAGGTVVLDPLGNAIAVMNHFSGDGYVVTSVARSASLGLWQQPEVTLSEPDGNALGGTLAIDRAGNAIAMWERTGPGRSSPRVTASFRPASTGTWAPAVDIAGAFRFLRGFDLAFDAAGNATAVWEADDVLYFAYRPFGGSWGPPELKPTPGFRGSPSLGVNQSGDAVVVWIELQPGVQAIVKAASRKATRRWGPSVALSSRLRYANAADIAIDPAGNAVATWTEGLFPSSTLRAGLRPGASGMWEPPAEIARGKVGTVSGPEVGMDGAGNALVAWDGDGIQAVELRGRGPVLQSLALPRDAQAHVPGRFSVRPVPWAAALSGQARWAFGDGGSATGTTVKHTYAAPGSYSVSVTQADASGSASTSTATIVVAPLTLANIRAPVVRGIPRVGATLTCLPGTWAGKRPFRFTYTWLHANHPIRRGTGQHYRLRQADVGALVACRVTAKNSQRSLHATSRPVRIRS
jgi:PKD domain